MINKIIKLIFKNLILLAISMFFIVTITFFMFEIIPGDIYDLDYIKNENIIENIREKYGLDAPIHIRYINTLKNTIYFDFGKSFINEGENVNEIIVNKFPVSAKIGIITILISLICGIILGIKLSQSKNNKKRNLIILLFVISTSIPTFVLSVILQYIFCVKFKILPVYGIKNFFGYILPIFILSITPTIFIARTLEREIKSIKNCDYVIAAKARGTDKNTIMVKYILKNCITLSYIPPIIANLIVGSFVIESIFNIPGLGRYFVISITNRDSPVVMGLTIFFSSILIILTAIFNILISVIDYRGDVNGQKYKK